MCYLLYGWRRRKNKNWMKLRIKNDFLELKELKMEIGKDNQLTRHIRSLSTDWILQFLHFLAYDNPSFRRLLIYSSRPSFYKKGPATCYRPCYPSLSEPVSPHALHAGRSWLQAGVDMLTWQLRIYYFRISLTHLKNFLFDFSENVSYENRGSPPEVFL